MAKLKQLQRMKDNAAVKIEEQASKPQKKKPKSEESARDADTNVPTKEGDLNDNNIGSQMLQKMGWKKGEGLGKQATGITVPIEVEMREKGRALV